MRERCVAVVFGTPAGIGGLGLQAATALASFARGGDKVVAIGPGWSGNRWPLDVAEDRLVGRDVGKKRPLAGRRVAWTPLRWRGGLVQWVNDRALGGAAARALDVVRPDLVYAFTQVAEEALLWCRAHNVPSILDNPNGHIRNFGEVYAREAKRWLGNATHEHPTRAMVRRVEREYTLAERIRVSSSWAKRSMTGRGVPAKSIAIFDQPVDLVRFSPAPAAVSEGSGPLRLCYAGSVDVRKGIFYLLRAMRSVRLPTKLVSVGTTGTRAMARALARERDGLDVTLAPGDPVPAYRASELFVLPSLEDGFGFVAAEAMACGLPVIVTDECGSAEWVAEADAGWVVPAGDAEALARTIDLARARRGELAAMGARGRAYVETRAAGPRCFEALHRWAWHGAGH